MSKSVVGYLKLVELAERKPEQRQANRAAIATLLQAGLHHGPRGELRASGGLSTFEAFVSSKSSETQSRHALVQVDNDGIEVRVDSIDAVNPEVRCTEAMLEVTWLLLDKGILPRGAIAQSRPDVERLCPPRLVARRTAFFPRILVSAEAARIVSMAYPSGSAPLIREDDGTVRVDLFAYRALTPDILRRLRRRATEASLRSEEQMGELALARWNWLDRRIDDYIATLESEDRDQIDRERPRISDGSRRVWFGG